VVEELGDPSPLTPPPHAYRRARRFVTVVTGIG
jgi:hypothetical protein